MRCAAGRAALSSGVVPIPWGTTSVWPEWLLVCVGGGRGRAGLETGDQVCGNVRPLRLTPARPYPPAFSGGSISRPEWMYLGSCLGVVNRRAVPWASPPRLCREDSWECGNRAGGFPSLPLALWADHVPFSHCVLLHTPPFSACFSPHPTPSLSSFLIWKDGCGQLATTTLAPPAHISRFQNP